MKPEILERILDPRPRYRMHPIDLEALRGRATQSGSIEVVDRAMILVPDESVERGKMVRA
ncbi:MAG: hypothetical protein ABI837_08830 [Acidobacteriota bacterium]